MLPKDLPIFRQVFFAELIFPKICDTMLGNFQERGFTVQDYKPIIAKNITALRQNHKMTQIELAEKLNYSDKAVSKWERGESIPDVGVLKAIADLFHVTVDQLLQEHENLQPAPEQPVKKNLRNPTVVTLLSILLVWFVATLMYVVINMVIPQHPMRWLPFLYAMPASCVVWLVLNSIWFNRRRNYWIVSALMWTGLISLVLTLNLFSIAAWQLFLLGILGQVGIIVWSHFHRHDKK